MYDDRFIQRAPGHHRSRVVLLGLAFLTASLATTVAIPWFDTALEYRVKAAFLYNFALFTEWPEGTFAEDDTAIVFGVLGEDPFGEILDKAIDGKTLHGRPLLVHRYRELKDLETCHILFVSSSEEEDVKDVVSKLSGEHVFSVSDIASYSTSGGTARFFLKNGKVSFEINTDAADREQLSISSQLLKLATLVTDEESD